MPKRYQIRRNLNLLHGQRLKISENHLIYITRSAGRVFFTAQPDNRDNFSRAQQEEDSNENGEDYDCKIQICSALRGFPAAWKIFQPPAVKNHAIIEKKFLPPLSFLLKVRPIGKLQNTNSNTRYVTNLNFKKINYLRQVPNIIFRDVIFFLRLPKRRLFPKDR